MLLVVPLGVLGSVLLTMTRGLSADVYLNVGSCTIIGWAAKYAILIVEFAIGQEADGKTPLEATLEAVKLLLRPIIRTSLAFIGGMIPLFIASGAGAASRIAVGTGVVCGMLAATVLGIFFIPLFYLSIRRWLSKKMPAAPGQALPEHHLSNSLCSPSAIVPWHVPLTPSPRRATAPAHPVFPHH